MIKECCDICHKETNDRNRTKITLKDYKGVAFDTIWYPIKRKWKGIICDDCLNKFREGENK